jgi:DNA polymerase
LTAAVAEPELDPREELTTLVAALRVHAELCRESGATGLEAYRAPPENRSKTSEQSVAADARESSAAGTGVGPRTDVSASRANDPGEQDREASARRLEMLRVEVSTCTRCRLSETRTQTVFARGTGSSGLCFVGEGPGADEDAQGFPFVGKAGQLLDRMIEAMGFARDEVYVANIVKCRPPNNRKPEPDEVAACRPYLVEQLELLKPKAIVALGATALEGLCGISGGITRLRGTWRLYRGTVAVMPTFHPAYLLRTPSAKKEVWLDLQEVVRHLGRSIPGRK